MKLDKKGFTIVEILAVVFILGVISSIAIIGVTRYKYDAINNDYEALAKSAFNAMEEYVMANQYETKANLKKLEKENYLSNRKDPASKNIDCDGAVVVEQKERENNKIDEDIYIVYLCCPNHKKIYTYPTGTKENLVDESYCDVED